MSRKAPRALISTVVCVAALGVLSGCDPKGATPPKPSTLSTEPGTPKGVVTGKPSAADAPATATGESGRGRNVTGSSDSGPASAAAATLPGGGLPQPAANTATR
jgi:hypothetical protein